MQELRYHRPGTAPATLIAPPEQAGHKPVIRLIEYDAHSLEEHEVENIEEIFKCLDNNKVSWIDISGLGGRRGVSPTRPTFSTSSSGAGGCT